MTLTFFPGVWTTTDVYGATTTFVLMTRSLPLTVTVCSTCQAVMPGDFVSLVVFPVTTIGGFTTAGKNRRLHDRGEEVRARLNARQRGRRARVAGPARDGLVGVDWPGKLPSCLSN